MSGNIWKRLHGCSIMVIMGILSTIWSPSLPNVAQHYGAWPYSLTPSIDQTFHNSWNFLYLIGHNYRVWSFTKFREIFIEQLQRVRHANRWRSLLRTPDHIPYRTCMCANVERSSDGRVVKLLACGARGPGSIPRLATWITEIGYLLPPSRDMAEIPLKRRKSSIQPTKSNVESRLSKTYQLSGLWISIILVTPILLCPVSVRPHGHMVTLSDGSHTPINASQGNGCSLNTNSQDSQKWLTVFEIRNGFMSIRFHRQKLSLLLTRAPRGTDRSPEYNEHFC